MNMRNIKIPLLIISIMIGFVSGLGAYTFYYAEGFSYMSDDPKVCINCHIMREQYDGWQKGSHHSVAVCNDCHLPHDKVGKYFTKGENGFLHSKAFTLMDFHEPITIRNKSSNILNNNCLYCHGDFTFQISHNGKSRERLNCVHCHKTVGHGPRI